MSDITMGDLYSVMKNVMVKAEPLNREKLDKKKAEIHYFVKGLTNSRFYMLLNKEKADYTLLDLGKRSIYPIRIIPEVLIECLNNRGDIKSIEITDDRGAVEIWISADNDAFVYYFFPYDEGVININEEVSRYIQSV